MRRRLGIGALQEVITLADDSVELFLPDDTHPLDAAAYRAADALSERTSRRGFLAKLGRVTFALLGVTVVSEVLPVGRNMAKADAVPCSTWYMCGFCGSQCGCGNCSGDITECPACACVGGSWTACCSGPGGIHHRYRYKDCYRGSCSSAKYNNCFNCHSCCNLPTGPYPGICAGQPLMCTKVNFVTGC